MPSILPTLQLIRRAGRITRRDLCAQLDLSFSMVSRLTSELLARGLVLETGRSGSEAGRPSDLLAINPQAGYALGLDISGARQRAVAVDLVGEIVYQIEENHPILAERDAILETLQRLTCRVLAESGLPAGRVFGVGVGVWGSVDPAAGVVYSWTETPGLTAAWKDYAVRDALAAHTALPHVLVDDIVRTLGLAEARYGHAARLDEDFVYALADTGVGVALMIGGQPYVGPNQMSGEIGHVPIPSVALPCNCGNIGCLETVASVTGILQRVEQKLRELTLPSALRDRAEVSIASVIAAAEASDRLAYQLMNEAGEAFGSGLAMTVNLLGPRLVVVGGRLAGSSVYLEAARRSMKLQVLGKASGVRVEASVLDAFAGARGAAAGVLNALFREGEHNLLLI